MMLMIHDAYDDGNFMIFVRKQSMYVCVGIHSPGLVVFVPPLFFPELKAFGIFFTQKVYM
jgi:hypothetical protein